MKELKVKYGALIDAQRWDIDYHLPPIEVSKFDPSILSSVSCCATVITDKRNPSLKPTDPFLYVDISCVDVVTGMITTPQELLGEEAPSRARKVIHRGDIIISSCRPTRGAIAIVPETLDNQICSTGFCVIRAKEGKADTKYLHFILRSILVQEQFRKFSTGSSYPAILDEDVMKTIIPLPPLNVQQAIANVVAQATADRNTRINEANNIWKEELNCCLEQIREMKM